MILQIFTKLGSHSGVVKIIICDILGTFFEILLLNLCLLLLETLWGPLGTQWVPQKDYKKHLKKETQKDVKKTWGQEEPRLPPPWVWNHCVCAEPFLSLFTKHLKKNSNPHNRSVPLARTRSLHSWRREPERACSSACVVWHMLSDPIRGQGLMGQVGSRQDP